MSHRVWVWGLLVCTLVGCAHQQTRLQSEDDTDREKDPDVKLVGDVTTVANADPVPLMGVGLVVGLEGTGGGAPPGGYRAVLEDQLRKKGCDQVKAVLSSTNTSLVLVSALVPPGAREGDRLDVEVTLPPQSKTTSLRGGYLKECLLYNYDSTRKLDPGYTGSDRPLLGHPVAKAEGPLLVGLGEGEDDAGLRQGRIWGGAVCRQGRPFYLVLNSDQQFARLAQAIADRVNETFHGPTLAGFGDIAVAKSKSVVLLSVPPKYQHNLPRYLRVVRLIPLREKLDRLRDNKLAANTGTGVFVGAGSPYRRRLEEQLFDPAKTITTALRLEALGIDSIPVLKRGLESDHALVRFASAEALAYLGSPACGEELARLIEQQPVLRAFGLTALASLDEAVSHVKLRELLACDSAEARYGAFRALRALDEHDAAVQGEQLNESFWLHRVAPNTSPLVHVSSSRRAEVVVFGEEPRLVPPFSFLAGEYTLTANRADERCTVSRFSLKHGTSRKQCSLQVEDVVRTMAELGAVYPDVVELLQQAGRCRSLSCRLAVDALPQATSVYELARAGADDPDLLKVDAEVLKAKADFGATPTLFERGTGKRPRSSIEREEEAALHDREPGDKKKAPASKDDAAE